VLKASLDRNEGSESPPGVEQSDQASSAAEALKDLLAFDQALIRYPARKQGLAFLCPQK
jgi:hypothetical protein